MAGRCGSGCALAERRSGAGQRIFAVIDRELFVAGGFSGDQCRRESGVDFSDGAFACGFLAERSFAAESEFGGERVGDRRVYLSGWWWGWFAAATWVLRLRFWWHRLKSVPLEFPLYRS